MKETINLSNLLNLTPKHKVILAKLLNQHGELEADEDLVIDGSEDIYRVTHSIIFSDLSMGPCTYVVGEGSYLAEGGQAFIHSFEHIILCYPDQEEIAIIKKPVIVKMPLEESVNESDMEQINDEVFFSHSLLLAGEPNPYGEVFYERISGENFDDYRYNKYQSLSNINFIDRIAMLQSLNQQVRALHKEDIVHRDIKSDNIIFDEESKLLRLIDAGCADVINGKKFSGTHGYFPPEYTNALLGLRTKTLSSHDIPLSDPSLDIYLEGLVFAEVLFRHPILTGSADNYQRLIIDPSRVHTSNFFLKGAEHIEDTLQDLCNLIKKMLSDKPSDRPNAQEVEADLNKIYLALNNTDHTAANQLQQQLNEIKIMFYRLKEGIPEQTSKDVNDLWLKIKNLKANNLDELKILFDALSENYHVLQKCIVLISQLNNKINNEKVGNVFTSLKNELIKILTIYPIDKRLDTDINKQITNINTQFITLLCYQQNPLILMHKRFIFSPVLEGNKEQQRIDFMALVTALFSSPNGDLEKKINSIPYKNTTDVLNKHRYFTYRASLLSCDNSQLAIIKDQYQQWIEQMNVEQLSIWQRRCHKSLMNLISPILKDPVSQKDENTPKILSQYK